MEKFTIVTGVTAPLPIANIDTDMLVRVEALMYVAKGKLGPYCFESMRYRPDRSDNPDFVLNKPQYKNAKILLTGPNFGCGSSREQAVWALLDMGIRCVIAPSFGDIFFGNCFQNGLLPIVLPAETVAALVAEAKGADFTVDLEKQIVVSPSGQRIDFKIDPTRRDGLLRGLDEIQLTLARENEIAAFQNRDQARRPWIYQF